MKTLLVTDPAELEVLNEISANHKLTLLKTWPDDGRRFVRDVRGNDLPWEPWGEWLALLEPATVTGRVVAANWTAELEEKIRARTEPRPPG